MKCYQRRPTILEKRICREVLSKAHYISRKAYIQFVSYVLLFSALTHTLEGSQGLIYSIDMPISCGKFLFFVFVFAEFTFLYGIQDLSSLVLK